MLMETQKNLTAVFYILKASDHQYYSKKKFSFNKANQLKTVINMNPAY